MVGTLICCILSRAAVVRGLLLLSAPCSAAFRRKHFAREYSLAKDHYQLNTIIHNNQQIESRMNSTHGTKRGLKQRHREVWLRRLHEVLALKVAAIKTDTVSNVNIRIMVRYVFIIFLF
jgi:hypothetical protein